MKKVLFFLAMVSFAFSVDLVFGVNFGGMKPNVSVKSGEISSNNTAIGVKGGLNFTQSRLMVSFDKATSTKKGEDANLITLGLDFVSDPDSTMRGFFGPSFGVLTYKNKDQSVSSATTPVGGLEIGLILLEKGDFLKHMELELGYKIHTGLNFGEKDEKFGLKLLHNYYVGFNFKF